MYKFGDFLLSSADDWSAEALFFWANPNRQQSFILGILFFLFCKYKIFSFIYSLDPQNKPQINIEKIPNKIYYCFHISLLFSLQYMTIMIMFSYVYSETPFLFSLSRCSLCEGFQFHTIIRKWTKYFERNCHVFINYDTIN